MARYNILNTEIKGLYFIYSLFEEAISYQKRKGYPVWVGYDKEVLKRTLKINFNTRRLLVIRLTVFLAFAIQIK